MPEGYNRDQTVVESHLRMAAVFGLTPLDRFIG